MTCASPHSSQAKGSTIWDHIQTNDLSKKHLETFSWNTPYIKRNIPLRKRRDLTPTPYEWGGCYTYKYTSHKNPPHLTKYNLI